MKNEFVLAFNEVLEEKQLPKEVVLEALQTALASAYRRHVNASSAQHVEAQIDPETGKVVIFAEKEVVDSVEDGRTEVALQDALTVDETAEVGSMVIVESTPKHFGRVAAQTARQVIQQRIREAERDAQFNHFSLQLGEIVSGVVQAMNAMGATLGLEMKAEGIMPRNHQIPGERYRLHDRLRALLLEVKTSPRGPQIILSRAHRNFLRRLLENEVPEIYHGMVEIRSIAREPGHRSKVAVSALQPGVDPVGACVGIRGVRIQAIVRELNDEKIDVIEWNSDPSAYIAKALSPARVSGVYLDEFAKGTKTATVVVPEDQLSLAIGRDGQNARLAAKLTSWKIDIKSLPEAATDALYKLQNDPEYAQIAENETPNLPQVEMIMAKKAEGRPVTPEEYHFLTQFVDRIERGLIVQMQAEKQAEEEAQRIAEANVPAEAFEIPLDKFEVSDRVYAVISEAGFETVGDLILTLRLDRDAIFRLNGMGPKTMTQLEEAIQALPFIAAQMAEIEAAAEEVEEAGEPVPEAELEVEPEIETLEEPSADLAQGEEEIPEEVQEEQPVESLAEEAAAAVEPEEQPAEVGEQVEEAVGEDIFAGIAEDDMASLDEIFALRPEVLDYDPMEEDEDEEEEDDDKKKKRKKKKKKKYIEMEYDPDKDVVVTKKKRKRGEDDWEAW